eukprot:gene8398-5880_t
MHDICLTLSFAEVILRLLRKVNTFVPLGVVVASPLTSHRFLLFSRLIFGWTSLALPFLVSEPQTIVFSLLSHKFDPSRKISPENVAAIKDLLRLSPSSVNAQPWHFFIASTPQGKDTIAKSTAEGSYSFNTEKVKEASHVVVLCRKTNIDEKYLADLIEKEAKDGRFHDEKSKAYLKEARGFYVNLHKANLKDLDEWMTKQVYLSAGMLLMGVAAMGIDAVPMEGFDSKVLDAELKLADKGLTSVLVIPLGYRSSEDTHASLPKSHACLCGPLQLFTYNRDMRVTYGTCNPTVFNMHACNGYNSLCLVVRRGRRVVWTVGVAVISKSVPPFLLFANQNNHHLLYIASEDVFLAVPLRTGVVDLPNWKLCLPYLESHHSHTASQSFGSIFDQMNALHKKMVEVFHPEKVASRFNDAFVSDAVIPYCKLVVQAQGHLPLHGGRVSKDLAFSWRSGFALEDSGQGNATEKEVGNICSLDANVELMSCVYNVAAAFSTMACRESASGAPDELKSAHVMLQRAAGYFEVLEGNISRLPDSESAKVLEFQLPSIQALKRYSLAQAHHCGYLMAQANQKPHSLLSKLAVKAAEMYSDVCILSTPLCKSAFGKLLSAHISATALVFTGRSYSHLAFAAEKETEMGQAVAYHYSALEYWDQAANMAPPVSSSWICSARDAADVSRDRAEKANNKVCRQLVPSDVAKPTGLPGGLGKPMPPLPFLEFTEPVKGVDPFFGIIPAEKAKESRKWREASQELLQKTAARAQQSRTGMESSLEALGVPALLLGSSSEPSTSRIPAPLRRQLLSLRGEKEEEGKVELAAPIMTKVQQCMESLQQVQSMLDEAEKLLKTGRSVEAPYLNKYGEVIWRSEFPDPLKSEAYSSLTALIGNQRAKDIPRWKEMLEGGKRELYDNASNISLIEMSLHDLEVLVPDTAPASTPTEGPMAQLKTLMAHKEAIIQSQKDAIQEAENLLQSDTLVYALAATPKSNQESVLNSETAKFKKILGAVDRYNGEFDALVREVENKVVEVAQTQSADPNAEAAQKVFNSLQEGLRSYSKINSSIEEALEGVAATASRTEEILSAVRAFAKSQGTAATAAKDRLEAKLSQRVGAPPSMTAAASGAMYAPPEFYDPSYPAPMQSYAPPQQQSYPAPYGFAPSDGRGFPAQQFSPPYPPQHVLGLSKTDHHYLDHRREWRGSRLQQTITTGRDLSGQVDQCYFDKNRKHGSYLLASSGSEAVLSERARGPAYKCFLAVRSSSTMDGDARMQSSAGSSSRTQRRGSSLGDTEEIMNNWKLQLDPGEASSKKRSSSRRSGLVLSAVSDVLRREAGGFHVHVPYPTHSIIETSSLLVSRYNTLLELYAVQKSREEGLVADGILERQREKLEKAVEAVERLSRDRAQSHARCSEMVQAVELLECQLQALSGKLEAVDYAKAERVGVLERMMARLNDQEHYWRDLWAHTRDDSPVTCVLAEQLERLWGGDAIGTTEAKRRSEGGTSPPSLDSCSYGIQARISPLLELGGLIAEGQVSDALALLQRLPQDVLDEDNNLLHWACSMPAPQLEIISLILQRRPCLSKGVDATTGNTALHFVCGALDPDERVVGLLLAAGVPAGTRNHAGLTAFHIAVLNTSDADTNRLKERLLGSGKSFVDERTSEGLTSLHLVCGDDAFYETSRYLVAAGSGLWALAPHQLNYPPYAIRKITPVEKSRMCFATMCMNNESKQLQKKTILARYITTLGDPWSTAQICAIVMYDDPYQQPQTRSRVANSSLFSHLYPSRPLRPHTAPQTSPPRPTSPLRSRHCTYVDPLSLNNPLNYYSYVGETSGVPDSRVTLGPLLHETEPADTATPCAPPFLDESLQHNHSHGISSPPKQPPFYSALKEVRRRIKEQLAVHAELNTASRQLDLVGDEVRIFRATHDTAAFINHVNHSAVAAEVIRMRSSRALTRDLREDAKTTIPSPSTPAAEKPQSPNSVAPSGSSQRSPANPFLVEVLHSFQRGHQETKGRGSTSLTTKEKQRRREEILAAAVRPEPPPVPYKRVVFVPVRREQQADQVPWDPEIHTPSSTAPRTVTARSDTETRYADDFDSPASSAAYEAQDSVASEVTGKEQAPSTQIATSSSAASQRSRATPSTRSLASQSAITTDVSHSTIRPSGAASVRSNTPLSVSSVDSVTLSVKEDIEGVEKGPSTARGAPHRMERGGLSTLLKEFFVNCQKANEVALQLAASADIFSGEVDGQQEHVKTEGEVEAKAKEKETWLHSVVEDVKDVKKLRHFTEHLQKHLKALDMQRKVRSTKKKLLIQAQKLSRARQKMRSDPALSLKKAAEGEVEDLMADFSDEEMKPSLSASGIADEVDDAVFGGFSQQSTEDESVAEDFAFGSPSGSSVAGDELEDAVEDMIDVESDGERRTNSSVVVDEVQLEALLDESGEWRSNVDLDDVEDTFADKLADASSVSDIMDEVELPGYGETRGTTSIVSVQDDTSIEDELRGSVSRSGSASEVEEEEANRRLDSTNSSSSYALDADVESAVPRSTSCSTLEPTGDSSVSSRDSLSQDIFWTSDRRKRALLRASSPPTFSQLYDPMQETESSSTDSSSARPNSAVAVSKTEMGQCASVKQATEAPTEKRSEGKDALKPLQTNTISLPEKCAEETFVSDDAAGDVAVDTESDNSAKSHRVPPLSTDFIALASWKEQQKKLIREMRAPLSGSESFSREDIAKSQDDGRSVKVDSFSHHWGVLEAMLHSRFPVRVELPQTCSQATLDSVDYSDSCSFGSRED